MEIVYMSLLYIIRSRYQNFRRKKNEKYQFRVSVGSDNYLWAN
jgi:hypothetical protein